MVNKISRKYAIYSMCIFLASVMFVFGCTRAHQEGKLEFVNIAFQEWVGYGLFYLAHEKGFCKDEGIELVFVDEQLDSARRDAFKQGMLDVEGGTLDLLISKLSQNTPLAAVMSIDLSSGSDGIVVSEGIKTLEDLKDKRIALTKDDVGDTFISILLHEKGMSLNDIKVVSKMSHEVAQAFLDNEADACVTWQPWLDEALQRPGSRLLASTKEYPGIIIDTLNVRQGFLTDNPHIVKGLMRAWFRALDFYKQHPEKASEIIAKYYDITPSQYMEQVKGLVWVDYEYQINDEWKGQLFKAFKVISEVKSLDSSIHEKPQAQKHIDYSLLETLYEDKK
jgi:NitT/TauT family transport system substrate-binding protein